MDLYQSTVDYLSTMRVIETWQGMRSILLRSASMRPRDWFLPVIARQAVGGSPGNAIPAVGALACAQISIILTDDMLDDDPRGEYHRIGHGRAANLAIAFHAAAVDALLESGTSSSVRDEAVKSLIAMMAETAYGQELDVQNPSEETAYWQVVEYKSASFYGCAFHLGALFADADPIIASGLKKLGGLYGEMIQIHDDLNDTMAVPANPDWLQGRKPLPILYALTVDHEDRARFLDLYEDVTGNGTLHEAQAILIRSGGISYSVHQLLHRHSQALEIIEHISLPHGAGIERLLDEIIAPVWRLFDNLGMPHPPVSANEEPGGRAG